MCKRYKTGMIWTLRNGSTHSWMTRKTSILSICSYIIVEEIQRPTGYNGKIDLQDLQIDSGNVFLYEYPIRKNQVGCKIGVEFTGQAVRRLCKYES